MRIQHNIMAMNAYRNYTNNTSALSKNLEKLSSGYKINRAGDDAAGLAISEKMRAQITGLDVAQKNAKDGISLVQTAEGALTEVHDMLNRMYELAEQSANGTYQDDVDRDNLQAELNALRDEIDRISQSANFNGIKLFTQNGEVAGATDVAATLDSTANAASLATVAFAFSANATSDAKQDLIDALGSKGAEISFKLSTGWSNGGKITLTGLPAGYTFTFDSAAGGTAAVNNGSISIGTNTASGKLGSSADLVLHMKSSDGTEIATLTIKKPGAAKAGTSTITLAPKTEDADASADAAATFDFTLASTAKTKFGVDSVDFTKSGLSVTATTAVKMEFSTTGDNLTVTVGSGAGATTFSTTLNLSTTSLAGKSVTLSDGKGNTISVTMTSPSVLGTGAASIAADTLGSLKPSASESTTDDTKITLQIGEDGNTYNQLTFNKRGISTADLGIGSDSINIDTQKGALAALSSIKTAINTISSIRGDLGAIQNRLDHTINNLSVMQENIQDAESTIRDTDVADEMMAYTKNNILVQSAQAMLAQANQVPQGVLQLLQ